MSTTTMHHTSVPATRFVPEHTAGVSHTVPLLLAIALLAASAVVSVLLSGPMH